MEKLKRIPLPLTLEQHQNLVWDGLHQLLSLRLSCSILASNPLDSNQAVSKEALELCIDEVEKFLYDNLQSI